MDYSIYDLIEANIDEKTQLVINFIAAYSEVDKIIIIRGYENSPVFLTVNEKIQLKEEVKMLVYKIPNLRTGDFILFKGILRDDTFFLVNGYDVSLPIDVDSIYLEEEGLDEIEEEDDDEEGFFEYDVDDVEEIDYVENSIPTEEDDDDYEENWEDEENDEEDDDEED